MTDFVFNRAQLKKKARSAMKLNYFACVAVCFIMVFLAGEYSTTVQGISMWDMTHVADLKYNPEQKKEIIQDMVDNHLTPEETDEKWKVNNVDAVKKWKKAYEDFGPDGLNSKEVTFFGTTGDGSTINTLLDAFSITKTAKERFEQLTNDSFFENLPDNAILYFDGLTRSKSYKFTLVASVASAFSQKKSLADTADIFTAFLVSLLRAVFVTNLMIVCECRFFMESRTYRKTKVGRMGFLFRERTLHPIKTMFIKDLYLTLWTLTIGGFFVKQYSYAMVPCILAENPNMQSRKVIKLSRDMMNGYKWELFKIDVTMLGWTLLSMLTLGVVGIFYSNPYRAAIHSEVYIALRRRAIEQGMEFADELNDKFIDLDLLQKQTGETDEEKVFTIRIPDSADDKKEAAKEGSL
ncbi:MAG: DUF975 family protein [Ruminococcus sp.]|nr:DUF975 family protein [Ruminococcus sp.]